MANIAWNTERTIAVSTNLGIEINLILLKIDLLNEDLQQLKRKLCHLYNVAL